MHRLIPAGSRRLKSVVLVFLVLHFVQCVRSGGHAVRNLLLPGIHLLAVDDFCSNINQTILQLEHRSHTHGLHRSLQSRLSDFRKVDQRLLIMQTDRLVICRRFSGCRIKNIAECFLSRSLPDFFQGFVPRAADRADRLCVPSLCAAGNVAAANFHNGIENRIRQSKTIIIRRQVLRSALFRRQFFHITGICIHEQRDRGCPSEYILQPIDDLTRQAAASSRRRYVSAGHARQVSHTRQCARSSRQNADNRVPAHLAKVAPGARQSNDADIRRLLCGVLFNAKALQNRHQVFPGALPHIRRHVFRSFYLIVCPAPDRLICAKVFNIKSRAKPFLLP